MITKIKRKYLDVLSVPMGEDSFTFKANDGKADSNIGTVRMNVEKGNAQQPGSYYGTPAS